MSTTTMEVPSAGESDVPTLVFVDPHETVTTYRVCLWAAPGTGKSVIACSAPGPILVLSADRPTAYQFARAYWSGARHRDIREVRYVDASTLSAVYRYLRDDPAGRDVKTIVIDPLSNIYDQLVRVAPKRQDGDPDYQYVNNLLLRFLTSLRPFDCNVVLVAHEKLNDGKKGDGLLYPALGGPALINKVLAEMDICAHLERQTRTIADSEGREREQARWVAQLQPGNGIVCKESTGTDLGPWRVADLSRWFEVANAALAPDRDMPWSEQTAEGWIDIAPVPDEHPPPVAAEAAAPAAQSETTEPEVVPAAPAEVVLTTAHTSLLSLVKALVDGGTWTPEQAKARLIAGGATDAGALRLVVASLDEAQAAALHEEISSSARDQRVAPAAAPGSVAMPDLDGLSPARKVAALKEAGCICARPLQGHVEGNPDCPLADHGFPVDEQREAA